MIRHQYRNSGRYMTRCCRRSGTLSPRRVAVAKVYAYDVTVTFDIIIGSIAALFHARQHGFLIISHYRKCFTQPASYWLPRRQKGGRRRHELMNIT